MGKRRPVLVLCSLLLGIALGCGLTPEPTATPTAIPAPTATPTATLEPTTAPAVASGPTATPIPGWKKFEARGIEIWLPGSYEGGDPSQDLDVIVERLRALGPDFAQTAQAIEQNPSAFVLWAFDSHVGDSGLLTSVTVGTERIPSAITIEVYLDMLAKQLPSQFRVVEQGIVPLDYYQAGRALIEFSIKGVNGKQVMYVIKEGNTIWAVNYTTSADEFDQKLPTFEQSARTFRMRP